MKALITAMLFALAVVTVSLAIFGVLFGIGSIANAAWDYAVGFLLLSLVFMKMLYQCGKRLDDLWRHVK
jgi:hypothetical protein